MYTYMYDRLSKSFNFILILDFANNPHHWISLTCTEIKTKKSELFFSFHKEWQCIITTKMFSYGYSFWVRLRTLWKLLHVYIYIYHLPSCHVDNTELFDSLSLTIRPYCVSLLAGPLGWIFYPHYDMYTTFAYISFIDLFYQKDLKKSCYFFRVFGNFKKKSNRTSSDLFYQKDLKKSCYFFRVFGNFKKKSNRTSSDLFYQKDLKKSCYFFRVFGNFKNA